MPDRTLMNVELNKGLHRRLHQTAKRDHQPMRAIIERGVSRELDIMDKLNDQHKKLMEELSKGLAG
jgi:predicted transcriptional regulator